MRCLAADGERAQLARIDLGQHRRELDEHHIDPAAKEVGQRRRAAFVRHVDDVDPRHRFEQFAGKMRTGAIALRGKIELVRMRLGKGDQLRTVVASSFGGTASTSGTVAMSAIGTKLSGS